MTTDPWIRLVAIANGLEAQYLEGDTDWVGSPFEWIKARPSRQVGAIGERILSDLLEFEGYSVERSPDSEADRVIEGKRVEIKFSTRWKSGGYKFQQIRDQDYEIAACLGISPQEAHLWMIPKRVLYEHVIGHTGQHGGAGASDTAWIHLDADNPLEWARPWGGSLAAGLTVARDLFS